MTKEKQKEEKEKVLKIDPGTILEEKSIQLVEEEVEQVEKAVNGEGVTYEVGFDFGATNIKCISNSKRKFIYENKDKDEETTDAVGKVDKIDFDGKRWILGRGKFDISEDVKFNQEKFLASLYYSLSKMADGNSLTFNIVAGLPIKHRFKLKEMVDYIKEHDQKTITINGVEKNITISGVEGFIEGVAILFAMDDDQLEELGTGEVMIFDIGGSTSDIVLLSRGVGKKRQIVNSHSVSMGIQDFYSRVRKVLSKTNEYITLETAMRVVETGEYIYDGEAVDLSFMDKLKADFVKDIIMDFKLDFKNSLKESKWVIAGGAGKHFIGCFKALKTDVIEINDVYANAKGYLKFAEAKF